MCNYFTKTKPGGKSSPEQKISEDLHRKVAAVTLDLSCGMVRQILKKGAPLEPVFAGQMLAVMETAMAGFGLTAEQAADLVADFAEAYPHRGSDPQHTSVALQ